MEHKITFRLPQDLYDKAKAKAKQEDSTLSQILRQFLREWIKKDPPEPAKESDG
jgi:predicted HicB family RNase H-like nuclease